MTVFFLRHIVKKLDNNVSKNYTFFIFAAKKLDGTALHTLNLQYKKTRR